MLLIYLYHSKNDKSKLHIYDNIRKMYIKKDENHEDFVNILTWEVKNLRFDMSIFNNNYAFFRNHEFFDFFGILYEEKWDSEDDLVFYGDPYSVH